jgi:hypothetical protein
LDYYQSRWYDLYLNRWIQPDSIIPDPYNPQSYDRYSYVRNNPVNRVDPSGHLDTCGATSGFNEQCVRDNLWTMDQYKNLIASKYGVTMAESGETWSFTNIRTAYKALYMIDDKLNGHLRSMIGGTTFTMASQPQCSGNNGQYNCYKGITNSTGVTYYSSSYNLEIPVTNFLHETGHLIDSVPATVNVFSGPITADPNNPSNNPSWTMDGYVNSKLLLGILKEPIQAFNMGEAYDTNEYWADAFANYVADNIDLEQSAGMDMYRYVNNALFQVIYPYY